MRGDGGRDGEEKRGAKPIGDGEERSKANSRLKREVKSAVVRKIGKGGKRRGGWAR